MEISMRHAALYLLRLTIGYLPTSSSLLIQRIAQRLFRGFLTTYLIWAAILAEYLFLVTLPEHIYQRC